MTDEATNQAADDATRADQTAGVADQGNAQTDDNDTSAFDRMPAPEEEGDETDDQAAAGEDDDETPDDPDTPADGEEETIEVERNGQKFRIPKALEPELLMQQDYTRKTQEVAETRRQVEEQAKALEAEKAQQAETLASLREDVVRVGVLDQQIASTKQQLAELEKIDWPAFRAKAQTDDTLKLEYERLRPAYEMLRDSLTDLEREHGQAKTDLEAKQTKLTEDQRTQAEQAAAKARQECGAALKAEGWNEERLGKAAEFATTKFGVTPEELGSVTDPRLWKVLDFAVSESARAASLETQLKQAKRAQKHVQDQTVQPAAQVKGSGARARDPSKAEGDGLGTAEWMRRRQAQAAKRRA